MEYLVEQVSRTGVGSEEIVLRAMAQPDLSNPRVRLEVVFSRADASRLSKLAARYEQSRSDLIALVMRRVIALSERSHPEDIAEAPEPSEPEGDADR